MVHSISGFPFLKVCWKSSHMPTFVAFWHTASWIPRHKYCYWISKCWVFVSHCRTMCSNKPATNAVRSDCAMVMRGLGLLPMLHMAGCLRVSVWLLPTGLHILDEKMQFTNVRHRHQHSCMRQHHSLFTSKVPQKKIANPSTSKLPFRPARIRVLHILIIMIIKQR